MPEGGDNFSVTVALVTRNRKTELRKALHSVLEQDASPEVVVLDDASTDGTSEMLREEFPSVSVHRQEHALGTTLARNLVTSLAGGDIVVHLDDDARFPSRTTVSQTVADFDHPRVAIVAIPFFDVVDSRYSERHGRAPDDEIWILATYTGAAYAARTDIFTHVGGYDGEYRMYGEERDLSLRLLAEGFMTRMGRADPALHAPSDTRSLRRQDILGRRQRARLVLGLLSGAVARHLHRGLPDQGDLGGDPGSPAAPDDPRHGRGTSRDPVHPPDPVSREVFALDRRLRRKGPLPLSEIEPTLPPLGEATQAIRTPRDQRSIASS